MNKTVFLSLKIIHKFQSSNYRNVSTDPSGTGRGSAEDTLGTIAVRVRTPPSTHRSNTLSERTVCQIQAEQKTQAKEYRRKLAENLIHKTLGSTPLRAWMVHLFRI